MREKLYLILWSGKVYGESQVRATSKKEAKRLAEADKDEFFERLPPEPDWEIEEIQEVEE